MAKKRKRAGRAKRQTAPKAKRKTAAKVKRKVTVKADRKSAARAGALTAPVPPHPAPWTMFGILHPDMQAIPGFRDAPEGWTLAQAKTLAGQAGIELTEDHWEVIRVLQGCYKDEVSPRLRLLHDALEARFRAKGGMKYLYGILPGGPIMQGCMLAGVKPPAGARDVSFGSVA